MNITLTMAFDVTEAADVVVTKSELRGIAHEFFDRLERRVGEKLAAELDTAQRAGLATGASASEVIYNDLPDYAKVVRAEFEAVFAELGDMIAEHSSHQGARIVVSP